MTTKKKRMALLVLVVVTGAIFLIADAVMLLTVMQPLFAQHLGDTLHEGIRPLPVALFYVIYGWRGLVRGLDGDARLAPLDGGRRRGLGRDTHCGLGVGRSRGRPSNRLKKPLPFSVVVAAWATSETLPAVCEYSARDAVSDLHSFLLGPLSWEQFRQV